MMKNKLDDKLNSLFSSLEIPQEKIDLEIQRECKFIKYYGFPFFLRKEERDKKIEVITINEYPKAKYLVAYYPYTSSADSVKKLNYLLKLLKSYYSKDLYGFTSQNW